MREADQRRASDGGEKRAHAGTVRVIVRGMQTPSRIAYGVLLVLSLLLLFAVLYPLRQPLFLAAVLAAFLHGWHDRFAAWLGERRQISATLTTIAVVLLVLVPLGGIATFAVKEAIDGGRFVRESLREGGVEHLLASFPGPLQSWIERALRFLPDSLETLSAQVGGGELAAKAVGGALSATSAAAFQMVTMLIALWVLLVDGRRLVRWIASISPLKQEHTLELLLEFRAVSKSVIGSTVATAAAQAAAATIGYLIARVPHALFFGLVTFFTAFIPAVGTALVALPIAGLLFLQGKPWMAAFVLCWSLFVVSMIDNLLKPMLIKEGVRLPGAVVFLSLFGGIVLFGPLGFIAGPLVVTFFLSMVRLSGRVLADQSPGRA
jgi:predicted PurR-regulated permease PerM